jgi:hypothetical protein
MLSREAQGVREAHSTRRMRIDHHAVSVSECCVYVRMPVPLCLCRPTSF